MSKQIIIATSTLLSLGVVALLPLLARSASEPREIVVVARDMSFFLASDPASSNPTIRVAPGEELRLVLRNDDLGFEHGVEVDDWGISIAPLRSGNSGVVVFRAPEHPGLADYVCTFHAEMMKGTIEVIGH